LGIDLHDLFETLCGAREDGPRASLDDRPLNQIGILHHQLDEFIVRQIAVGELVRSLIIDSLLIVDY